MTHINMLSHALASGVCGIAAGAAMLTCPVVLSVGGFFVLLCSIIITIYVLLR